MTATTTMRRTRSLWLASALVLFGTGLVGSGAAAAPTLGVAALLGEDALGPAITAVEPGELAAGATVVVRGSGFAAGDELRLDSVTLEEVKVSAGGDQISGTIPAKATKGKTLTVRRGGKAVASSGGFVFVPAPKLSAQKPAVAAPGETVTLSGKALDRVTAVTLGAATAKIEGQSASKLSFVVPEGATTGIVAVSSLGGQAALKKPLEVFYAPTLSGVAPTAVFEGEEVVASGEHLAGSGAGKVSFKIGSKALKVVSAEAGSARLVAVKGAKSGALVAEARKRKATLEPGLTIHKAPVISSVPGSVGAPGSLTVSGKELADVGSWRLGSATLTPDPSAKASASKVTLLVPAEASGSATLVATAHGREFASKKEVTVVRAPTLTAIAVRPAKSGSEGVAIGEHLTAKTTLKVGGKAAKVRSVEGERMTFTLAGAPPKGVAAAVAKTGSFSGAPLEFDGDAAGYRFAASRLAGLLSAPPSDYSLAAVRLDLEQSEALLGGVNEARALAGSSAGEIQGRGLRLAEDLGRMLVAEQALCASMAKGKAKAGENTALGEALRATHRRASELVGAIEALWTGLPAEALLSEELRVDEVDAAVVAALAATPRAKTACAGKFHGSSVVSEASKTIQGDLNPRYEAAMLGAFKNVMDQGKTYADVKKAVDARLTRFSPARASAWRKTLEASKTLVNADAGAKKPTGKGASGDKRVEPKGKPAGNKPGKQ
jgi:hypothetical protein